MSSAFDVQPAGGVEDDRVDALLACRLDAAPRDLDRDADRLTVLGTLVRLAVEVHLRAAGHLVVDGLRDDLELLDRCRSLQVGGDEHRRASLLLEVRRDLAAGRGLPGSLKPAHHDDGRSRADAQDRLFARGAERLAVRRRFAAEQPHELLVHDRDHLLAGLEALGDLASACVFEHALAEPVHDVEMHVGLEQAGAHLFHRLTDVGLADRAPSGELPEDAPEAIAQAFEHVVGSLIEGWIERA